MKKRLTKRYESEFDVVLLQNDSPISVCRTINICRDGVFIKNSFPTFVTPENLKIGFKYPVDGKTEMYKLPVTIIHRSNDGLGLQFDTDLDEYDKIVHSMLGYVSHSHQKQVFSYQLDAS